MSFEHAEVHEAAPPGSHVVQLLSAFTPMRPIGFRKIRVGGPADGGYVMIDDFPGCPICYSLGIGGDVSWDLDMASRNAIVYQYDPTVERPPTQHSSFRFFRLGIGDRDDNGGVTTIAGALAANGHRDDHGLILKMDIEDSEWSVIEATPECCLAQFSQIVVEYHGLARMQDGRWAAGAEAVLRKILRTHLPIHVHGNNWGQYVLVQGVPVPDVLEVTYASRACYSFSDSNEIYPSPLDRPCKAGIPDLFLGSFKFHAT